MASTCSFGVPFPAHEHGPRTIARCAQEFRETYARNWKVQTTPYPGIVELLDALSVRRLKMAVLSNKPDEATRRCVDEFFGSLEVSAGARAARRNATQARPCRSARDC